MADYGHGYRCEFKLADESLRNVYSYRFYRYFRLKPGAPAIVSRDDDRRAGREVGHLPGAQQMADVVVLFWCKYGAESIPPLVRGRAMHHGSVKTRQVNQGNDSR